MQIDNMRFWRMRIDDCECNEDYRHLKNEIKLIDDGNIRHQLLCDIEWARISHHHILSNQIHEAIMAM